MISFLFDVKFFTKLFHPPSASFPLNQSSRQSSGKTSPELIYIQNIDQKLIGMVSVCLFGHLSVLRSVYVSNLAMWIFQTHLHSIFLRNLRRNNRLCFEINVLARINIICSLSKIFLNKITQKITHTSFNLYCVYIIQII